MESIEAVFQAFGGPAQIGQALGISTEHAAGMKRRQSIPVGYWARLISVARERRIAGVTYETLALMHAAPPQRRRA